jgi:hypothetical protein
LGGAYPNNDYDLKTSSTNSAVSIIRFLLNTLYALVAWRRAKFIKSEFELEFNFNSFEK